MIVNIWKPIYSKKNNVRTIKYYEIVEDYRDLKKGWQVIYKCDLCLSNKNHHTTTSVLLNTNVRYNTLQNQTCRSCRSSISENEIKKTFIPFNIIRDSIIEYNYRIQDENCKNNYNNSKRKSQFKISVECPNKHKLMVTWNNWNKGKRCRKCYEENKYNDAVKYKDGWELYYYLVWKYTEENYKKYYYEINPNNIRRDRKFHLDHKYSISEGFKNCILPHIIGGVKNLEIIDGFENNSKGVKCSIKFEELS
jgi:hypothetical protein